jgi:hypothetical protein
MFLAELAPFNIDDFFKKNNLWQERKNMITQERNILIRRLASYQFLYVDCFIEYISFRDCLV